MGASWIEVRFFPPAPAGKEPPRTPGGWEEAEAGRPENLNMIFIFTLTGAAQRRKQHW